MDQKYLNVQFLEIQMQMTWLYEKMLSFIHNKENLISH